jgi:photosystem II stability/assembly factor-like uncharacterized protein
VSPARAALAGASIVAAVAVLAIGLLYVRLLQQQGAQEPLSRLSLAHAHAVVIDAHGGYWVGHHGGLLSSTDGRSWRAVGVSGDVMAQVASAPEADRILAFGHNLLVESRDAGASWVPLDHDLPGTDVHGAQALGQVIYAYVVGSGVFRSSNGATWERVGPALSGGVSALAALPGEIDVLFLAVDGGVLRSLDGGRTWGSAAGAGNMALPATVSSIAADIANGALYAAASSGLFRSTTLGSQWIQLPFRGTAAAVGAAGGHVGIVDDQGQFFLSRDGGITWAPAR